MTPDENKAIVRHHFEEDWNKGNLAVADELFAPDFVYHSIGIDPVVPPGPAGFKAFITGFRTALPDLHYTIERQIAEGDMVVTYWTASGTNTGPLPGVPPTGKSVTVSGISIDRMRNGQHVEDTTLWDQLGFLQQLGLIPPLPAA